MLPVVAFVGKSGAGKTTFAEQVVRALKAAGLRVGVAKHTHHLVDFDQPGKDSWRYAQAGGDVVVLGTPQGFTLFDRAGQEVELLAIARQLDGRVDLLIAEGYTTAPVPKIAVVRSAVARAAPCDPRDLIAVVSDIALGLDVPHFGFSEPQRVAAYLQEVFGLCRWEDTARAHPTPVGVSVGGAGARAWLQHGAVPSMAANRAAGKDGAPDTAPWEADHADA